MLWQDLPSVIDDWLLKAAAPGYDVRQAAANVITSSHVGYYYDPVRSKVGVFAPLAIDSDLARTKAAACRVVGPDNVVPFLSYQELNDSASSWVKVAYSPTLRRAGELLNFFPGQYPGGIPNSPSPVAAMLTSGLLGAGLGWGGGKLIGSMLPKGYGDNLGRTGAMIGAGLGAAPGATWMGANHLTDRSLNDPSLLQQQAGGEPINNAVSSDGDNMVPGSLGTGNDDTNVLKAIRTNISNAPIHRMKFGEDLDAIVLGKMYLTACEKVASTFGQAEPRHPYSPMDVNIDLLGRTLWDTGASPSLAATTMSGMYAAQQLPDPNSRPGWATGHQLGQLTENAVGDYTKGYLVGAAINKVIGTPHSRSTFGAGNAALGIIGSVIPKLFGG